MSVTKLPRKQVLHSILHQYKCLFPPFIICTSSLYINKIVQQNEKYEFCLTAENDSIFIVLIYISLITSQIDDLYMHFLTIYISSFANCYLFSCPFFPVELLDISFLIFRTSLFILLINSLLSMLQIFYFRFILIF